MPKVFVVLLLCQTIAAAAEPDHVIKLWTGVPPGPARDVGQEQDTSGPNGRHVADRAVIRLGNVSSPEAHVFLAKGDHRSSSAVVVCPGGGYNILAWDLEGLEVAEWLNSIGVTAIVLKYRVPTSKVDPKWLQPVQDAQRTLSLVRSKAEEWKLNADQIGILGFSAGGHAAATTALASTRHYSEVDAADQLSCTPNAAMLIYPAYLTNKDNTQLSDNLNVTETSPPMFLVHAFDDGIPVQGSLLLTLALKNAKVPSELHVYDTGGHGYGLRQVADRPVTTWPQRCEAWLKRNGWAR